eukprot:8917973-Lingulodinium_polyedra.AAC.1
MGAVETPECLKALLRFALTPVVERWERSGLGFHLHGDGDEVQPAIHQLFWADNVFLLARS